MTLTLSQHVLHFQRQLNNVNEHATIIMLSPDLNVMAWCWIFWSNFRDFIFHILHPMRYNSIIIIWSNGCTQFY